jgi:hypothetical protein
MEYQIPLYLRGVFFFFKLIMTSTAVPESILTTLFKNDNNFTTKNIFGRAQGMLYYKLSMFVVLFSIGLYFAFTFLGNIYRSIVDYQQQVKSLTKPTVDDMLNEIDNSIGNNDDYRYKINSADGAYEFNYNDEIEINMDRQNKFLERKLARARSAKEYAEVDPTVDASINPTTMSAKFDDYTYGKDAVKEANYQPFFLYLFTPTSEKIQRINDKWKEQLSGERAEFKRWLENEYNKLFKPR